MKDLNHALVEATRPPIYTSMKYWGKKPHNIWREFMENYSPTGGTVFDPFTGSGISAFEAVKAGKKAIAFDLNPLSSFMIEVLSSKLNEDKFKNEYEKIISNIEKDPIYIQHYKYKYNNQSSTIYNYRWLNNEVSKIALETDEGKRLLINASEKNIQNSKKQFEINIPFWYPDIPLPKTPSINYKFIKDIGGNSFRFLWTRRNLYLLSNIFSQILAVQNSDVQKQLLLGFIQTLHLTSKMIVPRSEKSKRDFSGSWGRADYMIRKKSMEQNPLILLKRSCLEKQGVLSALGNAKEYLKKKPSIHDVKSNKKINSSADINYGIIDISDIDQYMKEKSVDFIITDPPYAGLVMYLDLSMVWLSWLSKIDQKYIPDFMSEITVKKGQISREQYKRKLTNAFKQMHTVLKDDGKIIITFHHKKIAEWNDFIEAVKLAGFKLEKVTHQYNKRSGESNVANPYGTSGADFYIRCIKASSKDYSYTAKELDNFIVQKTINIIAERNEPTPYEFILAGLIPEMIEAGYISPTEYKKEIDAVLLKYVDSEKIFIKSKNTESNAGDNWWFVKPEKHINYPDLPLKNRVEELVISLLRRKVSVKLDDILAEIFRTYPNGLTPDPKGINKILEKHAYKASGRWKIKDQSLKNATAHTDVLQQLANIAHKINCKVFIGKREQHEITENGEQLRKSADLSTITSVLPEVEKKQIDRIEMIDQIWIDESNNILAIFEVENSTNFMSAIQRGSNLDDNIPKYMIIPDRREKELLSTKDPLFVNSFHHHGWSFIKYETIKLLSKYSKTTLKDVAKEAKYLDV